MVEAGELVGERVPMCPVGRRQTGIVLFEALPTREVSGSMMPRLLLLGVHVRVPQRTEVGGGRLEAGMNTQVSSHLPPPCTFSVGSASTRTLVMASPPSFPFYHFSPLSLPSLLPFSKLVYLDSKCAALH
jgi:hypothetical protein